MAVKEWTWPLVALVGAALLAVWLLPAGESGFRAGDDPSPAERRADSLAWLARDLQTRHGTAVRRDSVEALLVRDDPGPGSLLVRLPADGPAGGTGRTLLEAARREMPSEVESGRRVVVLHVDGRLGDLRADLEGREPRQAPFTPVAEYFAGGVAVPYCAVVLPDAGNSAPRDELARDVARGDRSLLGPCYFIARYGAPGPSVAAWMERGGWRLAEGRSRTVEGPERPPAPAGLFGGALERLFGMAPSVSACLSGSEEACVETVTDSLWLTPIAWGGRWGRATQRHAPAIHSVGRHGPAPSLFRESPGGWASDHVDHDMGLLRDIERDLGPEAFRRLWRTEDPVEEAFRSVAGTPLGEWVHEWSRQRFAPRGRGAALDGRSLVLSLLTLGALVGLGLWVPRTWKVT